MASSSLSPGVYVEEVSSGSRPIEAAGTAVAAFVGFAEKGPANQPTLVTNWTQYTQTFGGFIAGSYLAHAVYGYFANGGGSAYVVRVGGEQVAEAPVLRAELPAASEEGRAAFSVRALPSANGGAPISVEVQPGEDDTFNLVVKRGGAPAETFEGLTVKRGPANVVTAVKTRSKLIEVEETRSLAVPRRGEVVLATATPPPVRGAADDYVGDAADRTGFARLEAIDEVTMLCVPDVMAARERGLLDDEGVRAVQLAMITHCELMRDRVAVLDTPPGLTAQQVKNWRTEANYDSKYAALYYPWVKIMDLLSGAPMYAPPSGHMAGIWARNDATRGVHKAPANEVVRRHLAGAQSHQGRARPTQPGRHQLHPLVPGPGHPGVGRPHAELRPGVALPQRPAPLQLRREVHPQRHQLGGLRAERPEAVGLGEAHHHHVPAPGVARRRPVRADAGAGVLRQVRRREQPAREPRRRHADRRDRHRPGQAGRVRHLPHLPVRRRRRSRRVGRNPCQQVSGPNSPTTPSPPRASRSPSTGTRSRPSPSCRASPPRWSRSTSWSPRTRRSSSRNCRASGSRRRSCSSAARTRRWSCGPGTRRCSRATSSRPARAARWSCTTTTAHPWPGTTWSRPGRPSWRSAG